jgi:hypothetical protein
MHMSPFLIDLDTYERCIEERSNRALISLIFFERPNRLTAGRMPVGWAFSANGVEFSTELSTGALPTTKKAT